MGNGATLKRQCSRPSSTLQSAGAGRSGHFNLRKGHSTTIRWEQRSRLSSHMLIPAETFLDEGADVPTSPVDPSDHLSDDSALANEVCLRKCICAKGLTYSAGRIPIGVELDVMIT